MNERIKELFGKALDQAVPETWTTLSHEQMTKLSEVFAQLIVRECADFVAAGEFGDRGTAEELKEHFGVKECWCESCKPNTMTDIRMILCQICGNKRCPHATNHIYECTNSNEPGQKGSSWENYKVGVK